MIYNYKDYFMKTIKTAGYVEAKKGKKKWNPNPWAVCHSTVDSKKSPAKYERCVMDVKKKQKKD